MVHKAGIIGAGGVAGLGMIGQLDGMAKEQLRASHAGGYAAIDGIELVSIADVDTDSLTEFGDIWNISQEGQYQDYQNMLEEENLDVISVCTPTSLHYDHVSNVANSSCNPDVIWCEKPIADSVSDAKKMVEVCNDNQIELVVNHTRRFDDDIRQLRDLIQDQNLLGDIRAINMQFKRELLRNGTHYVDLAYFLTESNADCVTGFIIETNDQNDLLDVDIELNDFGGGGSILLDDDVFVTIDCTVSRSIWTGTIDITGTDGKVYINQSGQEWRYWEHVDDSFRETSLPDSIQGGTVPDLDQTFPNAVQHILDLLEGRDENRSPGTEAVHITEIIIGMFLSGYTGSHISLPLEQPLEDVEISSW
jgi:predicted dehydrogenase